MTALVAAGGVGGLVTFVAAVWVLARGIFSQIDATKDNTNAVRELAPKLEQLNGRVQYIEGHLGIAQSSNAKGGK